MNHETKILTHDNFKVVVFPSSLGLTTIIQVSGGPFLLEFRLRPTEAKDLATALTKAAKGVKDG